MAEKIYILSVYTDLEPALRHGSFYDTLEEALEGASEGRYIHTVYADLNEVEVPTAVLGKLVR